MSFARSFVFISFVPVLCFMSFLIYVKWFKRWLCRVSVKPKTLYYNFCRFHDYDTFANGIKVLSFSYNNLKIYDIKENYRCFFHCNNEDILINPKLEWNPWQVQPNTGMIQYSRYMCFSILFFKATVYVNGTKSYNM